ncbi:MAG: response regulator [Candidatus Methanosuratincola sp.]
MAPEVLVEIIKIVPSILWFVFVAVLIAWLYKPIKTELLPRLNQLKVYGVEATFIRESLEQAAKKQEIEISKDAKSKVERRLQRDLPLLRQMRILWVDDNPGNIIYESRILRSAGAQVDIVASTEQALYMLSQDNYDMVISDIARNGRPDEGLRFLADMRKQGLYRPTVFYASAIDWDRGTPPYAFGITNRVDHLLHYVMDIAEREKI